MAGPAADPAPGRRRPASPARMLGRGLLRRCPRCGSGRVFANRFRMVERCGRCGLRFEREDDFFLGAYVVNLAVTEGLLAVALFGFIILQAANSTPVSVGPVLVVTVVVAVAGPVAFFPFTRTIWAALDLSMRPVPEDDEPAPPGPLTG